MEKNLGKNLIEILPGKKEFSPGEKLEGTVRLRLEKPMAARGLHVSFFGTEEVLGNKGMREDFKVAAKLSGSRLYSTYEAHAFALDIPVDLRPAKNYAYYLKAWLDIPASLDVLAVNKVSIVNVQAQDIAATTQTL